MQFEGKQLSKLIDNPVTSRYINENPLLKELLGYGLIKGIIFTNRVEIHVHGVEKYMELIVNVAKEVNADFIIDS